MVRVGMRDDDRISLHHFFNWNWQLYQWVAQVALIGSLKPGVSPFLCQHRVDEEGGSCVVDFDGGIANLLDFNRLGRSLWLTLRSCFGACCSACNESGNTTQNGSASQYVQNFHGVSFTHVDG